MNNEYTETREDRMKSGKWDKILEIKIDIDALVKARHICAPIELDYLLDDDNLYELIQDGYQDDYPEEEEFFELMDEYKGHYLIMEQFCKKHEKGYFSYNNEYKFEKKKNKAIKNESR